MHSLADSCRYGALAFLNGVLAEWGKRELAAWLAGPYADVLRRAGSEPLPESQASPPSARALAPYAIRRVMRDAHDEVVDTMRTLMDPDAAVTFAFHAMASLVELRSVGDGESVWAPRAASRIRLADRVLSLVAIDYFARPDDYAEQLAVCVRCGLVAFDAAARARGVCRVHASSGLRFSTVPPPAEPVAEPEVA